MNYIRRYCVDEEHSVFYAKIIGSDIEQSYDYSNVMEAPVRVSAR